MMEKLIKYVIWATFIFIVIFFIIIPAFKGEKVFFGSGYNYKVCQIEYRDGSRGVPAIKTDNGWVQLSVLELKIARYIQVGDSIIKKENSNTIKVLRRNEAGKLVEKEFN